MANIERINVIALMTFVNVLFLFWILLILLLLPQNLIRFACNACDPYLGPFLYPDSFQISVIVSSILSYQGPKTLLRDRPSAVWSFQADFEAFL